MPRGYRRYILAALGWLILAAASPQQNDRAQENRESDQAVSNALGNVAAAIDRGNEPPNYNPKCDAGHDDRASDLCAQWKAADSASQSATAAVIGLAIGFLTFGAAIAAAIFAKKAADHTETGAAAARDAVVETKRIGEAQVRAYCTFREAVVSQTRTGKLQFHVQIANSGQSPARKLVMRWQSAFGSNEKLLPDFSEEPREFKYLDEIAAQATIPTPDLPVAASGEGNYLFITIRLDFRDVFDVPATTKAVFTAMVDQVAPNMRLVMLPVASLLGAIQVEREDRA